MVKGFFLIELMLCITLASFVAISFMRVMTICLLDMYHHNQTTAYYHTLFLAQQLLMKDLDQAQKEHARWIKAEEDELIWSIQEHAFSWKIQNNKLMRKKGIYDPLTHQWSHAHTMTCLQTIDKEIFRICRQEDFRIHAIYLTISNSPYASLLVFQQGAKT